VKERIKKGTDGKGERRREGRAFNIS